MTDITKLRTALMRRFEFDQCIHASSIDDEIERWMKEMGIGQKARHPILAEAVQRGMASEYDVNTQSFVSISSNGGGGVGHSADSCVYARANAAVAQEVQRIIEEKRKEREKGLLSDVATSLFPGVHYVKWNGNT